jgi:hypothetical protein
MPERGDLIWIFEHEIMVTAVELTAILQCFPSKRFLSKTRPEQSPVKVRLGAAVVARAASSSPPSASSISVDQNNLTSCH